MTWMAGVRLAKEDEGFREKIAEMATEFCLEASVLISVLGILEAAIAWKGIPPVRDFLFSGSLGAGFFAMGCMIQVQRAARRRGVESVEGEASDLRDS